MQGLRRVKRTRRGEHPHKPQGTCVRRSILRPAVVGHPLVGAVHARANVEVEVQLYASPLELGSVLAVVVEHHEICGEEDRARVVGLEFAVSDGGESLAGVNKVLSIVFSLWGKGPATDGGVVEFETIYARIQGGICARVEPEAESGGSVAERKKRVWKSVGNSGGKMEGDVVEDLVWHCMQEGGHGGLWEGHPSVQLGHGSEQRYFYRNGLEARLPVSVVRHAGDCPRCPAEIIARRPGSVFALLRKSLIPASLIPVSSEAPFVGGFPPATT